MEKTLTKQEVADLLRVHTRTVDRLRKTGELPAPLKIGRSVRWRHEDVRRLIGSDSSKSEPAA